MKREDKIAKKKNRSIARAQKNKDRNHKRWKRTGRKDCPYDVDMYDKYGTCNCNGENYNECLGDI